MKTFILSIDECSQISGADTGADCLKPPTTVPYYVSFDDKAFTQPSKSIFSNTYIAGAGNEYGISGIVTQAFPVTDNLSIAGTIKADSFSGINGGGIGFKYIF